MKKQSLTQAEKVQLWLHAVDCANEALSGKNKGRTAYEDVYKLVVKEYLKWVSLSRRSAMRRETKCTIR